MNAHEEFNTTMPGKEYQGSELDRMIEAGYIYIDGLISAYICRPVSSNPRIIGFFGGEDSVNEWLALNPSPATW